MSSDHLEAVFLALFLYALLGVSYFGWGKGVEITLGRISRSPEVMPITYSIDPVN